MITLNLNKARKSKKKVKKNMICEYIMLIHRVLQMKKKNIHRTFVILVDVYKIVINSDAIALFSNQTV